MGVLLWLVVPIVVTLLAVAWLHWAARPRGPVETRESLEAHERFKRALSPSQQSPERRAS
jgi:hypothetical protein